MTGKNVTDSKIFATLSGALLKPASNSNRIGVITACLELPLFHEDLFFSSYGKFWKFMMNSEERYSKFITILVEEL